MAERKFSRKIYIQLLAALAINRQSGILQITVGRSTRSLFITEGQLLSVSSNIPDETVKALLETKLVDENLEEHEANLEEHEVLAERLLQKGLITHDDLLAFQQQLLSKTLRACVRWKRGTWKFSPISSNIDPDLIPNISLLDILWLGIVQNLSTQDIFSVIGPIQQAGTLRCMHSLSKLLPEFPKPEIIKALEPLLQKGQTVEEISNHISQEHSDFYNSGNLFRLLWLLYHSGFIEPNQEVKELAKQLLHSPKANPEATAGQAGQAGQDRLSLSAKIEKEHRKRMGKDYYSFLGIEPISTYPTIEKVCKKLLIRWKTVSSKKKLTENGKRQISELIQGLLIIRQTLTKADLREEYNRRLKQGRAPKVVPIQAASLENLKKLSQSKPSTPAAEAPKMHPALELIEAGKFKAAYPLLDKARLEDGSNPDIYAAIGWTIWNLRRDRSEAENYLQLARQFNRRHVNTYLYLSKIALACSDIEAARPRLKALISLDPKSSWAQKTLNNLPQQEG